MKHRRNGRLRALCAAACLWALAGAGALAAQEDARAPAAAAQVAASPTLADGHWSRGAALRLQAAGLLPMWTAPRAAVTRALMSGYLADAAARAEAEGSPLGPVAREWLALYQAEYPETLLGPAGARLGGGFVGGSLATRRGVGVPGLGEFPPDRTGATVRADEETARAGAEVAALLGGRVAAVAQPYLGDDGVGVARWDLVGRIGSIGVALGEWEVGYGSAAGGGVVLSGVESLPRLQVATLRPARLPGPLRLLGPVSFHSFTGPLGGDRHPGTPWLWGAAGAVHPHPRVALTVHRAALIGGDGTTEEITAFGLLQGLIGKHAGFENQIVSVEGRLRLPTEGWLPLTAYCEVGAEDSSGAFYRVPGVVCGGLAPVLPSLPSLGVGVEYGHFGESCCGNPEWYRHYQFPGSWATEAGPLGHPLGGHGTQLLGYGLLSAAGGRVQARGEGFVRDRRRENLFVPGRAGESVGAGATLLWRPAPRAEAEVAGGWESGDGWSERALSLSVRVLY